MKKWQKIFRLSIYPTLFLETSNSFLIYFFHHFSLLLKMIQRRVKNWLLKFLVFSGFFKGLFQLLTQNTTYYFKFNLKTLIQILTFNHIWPVESYQQNNLKSAEWRWNKFIVVDNLFSSGKNHQFLKCCFSPSFHLSRQMCAVDLSDVNYVEQLSCYIFISLSY